MGWVLEFAKHFAEVHIICLKKGLYEFPPHIFVYSLGKEEGENHFKYFYRFYKYFGQIFFKVRVDYVFFHMGEIYNLLAAPFFIIRGKTKFYWWKAHGHINLKAKIALNFVDRVYTSTESGFSISTPKKHIIGQAIDVDKFVFPEVENRNREIVFVGRVGPVKRLEDFIETAKILADNHPDLSFGIFGPTSDEAYLNTLKEKINQFGLTDKTTFYGPKSQEELVIVYQNAFLFLNPSVTHSMDKTVVEGILCGCLTVTGNRAFLEILSGTNLYVTDATPEEYATVISDLLKQDNLPLAKQLRERAVKAHSLNTLTQRIFNL